MNKIDLSQAVGGIADAYIQEAADFQPKAAAKRPIRFARVAVLAAALALLATSVVAVYQRWTLEPPESYAGEDTKPQSTVEVHYESETDHYYTDMGQPAASDQAFLDQARAILEAIGGSADQERICLTHYKDEQWNREVVCVTFPQDGAQGEVSFDAATGNLLKITRFAPEAEAAASLTEAQALDAAFGWYQKLPYCQGYQFSDLNPVSEESWIYSFSRQINVELEGENLCLTNALEEVRIILNPKTGDFLGSNAFYVPLLDDHQPEDTPVSQKEAIELAIQAAAVQDPENWVITAQYSIVFPNWCWTQYMTAQPVRRANVTRLAWTVKLEEPDAPFANVRWVYVDLYTGQVLGGDMVR